jgi:hypothetical protein
VTPRINTDPANIDKQINLKLHAHTTHSIPRLYDQGGEEEEEPKQKKKIASVVQYDIQINKGTAAKKASKKASSKAKRK